MAGGTCRSDDGFLLGACGVWARRGSGKRPDKRGDSAEDLAAKSLADDFHALTLPMVWRKSGGVHLVCAKIDVDPNNLQNTPILARPGIGVHPNTLIVALPQTKFFFK